MKRLSITFAITALALVSGCKQSSSDTQSSIADDPYPLGTGDFWTYRSIHYDASGAKTDDTTGTMSISSSQIFRGHQAYGVLISGEINPTKLTYRDGTDYYGVDISNSDSLTKLFFRNPMQPGETITLSDTTVFGSRRYKETLKFIGDGEKIHTAAGDFDCLHYQMVNYSGSPQYLSIDDITESFYAKGVGLVLARDSTGIVMHFLSGTFELTDYHVQ